MLSWLGFPRDLFGYGLVELEVTTKGVALESSTVHLTLKGTIGSENSGPFNMILIPYTIESTVLGKTATYCSINMMENSQHEICGSMWTKPRTPEAGVSIHATGQNIPESLKAPEPSPYSGD
ncbi:hypothetical protein H9L39_08751 [Fusarium oxysporum f. sp. albedinis]|nr:hypothetical protein H9L39_08751 [Fusarium oxysporum f. sp. albedinis]